MDNMTELRSYQGVEYSIPPNDDGAWRYKIHPGRVWINTPRPCVARVDGYQTLAKAITAVEKAIDDWIDVGPTGRRSALPAQRGPRGTIQT